MHYSGIIDFRASEVQNNRYQLISRVEDVKPPYDPPPYTKFRWPSASCDPSCPGRASRYSRCTCKATPEEQAMSDTYDAWSDTYDRELRAFEDRTRVSFECNSLHDMESLWWVAVFLLFRHEAATSTRQRHVDYMNRQTKAFFSFPQTPGTGSTYMESFYMKERRRTAVLQPYDVYEIFVLQRSAHHYALALMDWLEHIHDDYVNFERDLKMDKVVRAPKECYYPDLVDLVSRRAANWAELERKRQLERDKESETENVTNAEENDASDKPQNRSGEAS